MIIYEIFQYVLMFGGVILIGYPFILGILALLPQRKPMAQTAFNHSFLIVVHSRNKEQKISKTLYSLAGLVYPWNLYDLMVVTDHCTEDTATISKRLGARIIEGAPAERNGPTDIVQWALEQVEHLEEKYDAIVFVGANDLISGNFLEIMNRYLEEGSVIIQSAHRKFSEPATWKNKLQRVSWLLRTYIDALGRKKMGLGTMLSGSGMCFKTEVLKNNPVKLSTAQQDFEYGILLQAKGLRVDFAPEALIWSPLYDSSAETGLEQSPWAIGQFQRLKKRLTYFSAHFNDGKWLQRFDLLIWMIALPLTLLFAVAAGNCVINLVLWGLGYISARFWLTWKILIWMVIIYLSIGIAEDRDSLPEASNDGKKKSKFSPHDK